MRPIIVKIENPRTLRTVKLLVDDLTRMSCAAARRLIMLDGVFYRYVIRSEDIIACGLYQPGSTRYIVLKVRIAGSAATLPLALSHNGLVQELLRQLSFNATQPRLARVLERTLARSADRPILEQECSRLVNA